MTSRERVFKTLAHEEPDRVPYNLRPSNKLRERLQQEHKDSGIDFPDFFKHDIRYVRIPIPECPPNIPICTWLPMPSPNDISQCK